MSKLGKIFMVNYNGSFYNKQVYPVVYENKGLYVCKVPGSDNVATFYKKDTYYKIYSAQEFIELIDNRMRQGTCYRVYVKPDEEVNFEKYRETSENEKRYNDKKAELTSSLRAVENYIVQKKLYEQKIEQETEKSNKLSEEVARLKKLVEKEKGYVSSND